MARFLGDRRDEKVWTVAREARGVYWVGEGPNALEVVYVESPAEPTRGQVSGLWRERQGKRAAPVLLVAAWPEGEPSRAWLCGPIGEDPPMVVRDLGQAERLAAQALAEPTRTFAIQYLNGALVEVDDPLPGVRNDGLLATHELREGVRRRKDWKPACERSRDLVNLRDRALVEALGYRIEQRGDHAVLRAADGDEIRAVAVFLDRGERPDRPSARFDQRTPVTHSLTLADREGLRWVVAVRGSTLRLYSTATSGASGQRGRTETFVELDLPLLADEHAGYLTLLFAADALAAGGTFDEIAAASRDFTTGLSERMRERIYDRTIPDLALAIARRHNGLLDKAALDAIYHTAMTVLFRLLFLAYAEDQRLLPYAASEDYRANSLKALAQRFAHRINEGEPLGFRDPFRTADDTDGGDGTDELWSRCRALFQAVDRGNAGWDIPAYNGGLFSEASTEGQRIAGLTLTNAEFGPALAALVLDRTPDGGVGPIDFRSLSVREFGSIYEGLLESELAVAEQDLTLKTDSKVKAEVYVPSGDGERVVVASGAVYLHNASGARKATGSYFTPPFVVDHLIDTALRPTLTEHLEHVEALLDAGDDAAAAELLLDFRVADISMGSGHFLTAAIDAIEAMVTDFLARRPIPKAAAELARLNQAAVDALGDAADRYDIEGSQLLRRLIARRCIYGVDLNPIAVELARVSVWIHTFVPGLPLSFLDRTLIVGDSLTGIGTVQEAVDALTSTGKQGSLFDDPIRQALKAAEEPLKRLGTISDATLSEVAEAADIASTARDAVRPVTDVFDLIVAQRVGELSVPAEVIVGELPELEVSVARGIAENLNVVHFPVAFPEVFLRDRGGFDVIIGNPPWEKVNVDEYDFWARFAPGIRRGLNVADREAAIQGLVRQRPDLVDQLEREKTSSIRLRNIVTSGPYNLGTGHTELARVFAWRFWALIGRGGRIGVVLPRTASLSAPGMAAWRAAIIADGGFELICELSNTRGWVFRQVHPQQAISLIVTVRTSPALTRLKACGPFQSLEEFQEGVKGRAAEYSVQELATWSSDLVLPKLPMDQSVAVFRRLTQHPSFSNHPTLKFRPVQGDINAHGGKGLFISDAVEASSRWPVYAGSGFNLWNPETGTVYAWVNNSDVTKHLLDRRRSQARTKSSAFYGLPDDVLDDPGTLPCYHPRIAFRDVTGGNNSRTVVAALIPPQTIVQHTAPYLLRGNNTATDEAFLLGVLSSIPLDWAARRQVELHVTFGLLGDFPVPSPDEKHPGFQTVVDAVGRLAAIDSRFTGWARDVGVPVGSVASDAERDDLVTLIDAAVARLYGLDRADVEHIFETFHTGWDPSDRDQRLAAVLEHLDGFTWDPAPTA